MKIDFLNSKKMQTIKGFGTSACWWSQNCKGEAADEIAEMLYGDTGLRLNIYRYNVGGGTDPNNYRVENPWRRSESFYEFDREEEKGHYNWDNDKTAVEFMKKCLDKGNIDTLIFFANSPHWAHTSTGQASGSLMYHTCNLPQMNYQKFVDYMLDIAEHFINEGYPVKYISPINEPQWKWGGSFVWQEGCHYEPKEVLDIFHLFAESIEKRKLPVKLYGFESGEMLGDSEKYFDLLLNDELVMKYMPIYGYHSYHDDDNPENRVAFKNEFVSAHPELRFDMSEWCELPNKSPVDDFKGALITARIIGQDLITAGAESWTAWVAVNQFAIHEDDGKDYADSLFSANDDFTKWGKAMRYYALAHFSKFIPLGSVCLDTNNPPENGNKLNAFSFLTPDGKTVTVIDNEGEKTAIFLNGNFEKMQVVASNQTEQLKIIYSGKFTNKLEVESNTLLTVVME